MPYDFCGVVVKGNTESAWLSLRTFTLGTLMPYCEEGQDTWKQYVGRSSQQSRSTLRLMSEQCSDDGRPELTLSGAETSGSCQALLKTQICEQHKCGRFK